MKPVTLLILGGGDRGTMYADYARQYPDQAKVVGVAEPREFYRQRLARDHALPAENVFTDWKQALARPKLADAPSRPPPSSGTIRRSSPAAWRTSESVSSLDPSSRTNSVQSACDCRRMLSISGRR